MVIDVPVRPHSHLHAAGHIAEPLRTRRGLTVFLWLAVVAVVAGATAGVWTLWPRHPPTSPGRLPTDAVHADPFDAVVLSVARQACPGTVVQAAPQPRPTDAHPGGHAAAAVPGSGSAPTPATTLSAADRAVQQALQLAGQLQDGGDDLTVTPTATAPSGSHQADGTSTTSIGGDDAGLVTDASCVLAQVRLLAGPDTGRIQTIPIPGHVLSGGLKAGDHVTLARFAAQPGAAPTYGWVDYSRGRPLALLAIAFLAVVLLAARWRGVTALVGLGLGYLTIAEFMLPALRAGSNPLEVALCGATAIMVVILYVAHGLTAKTTTALLGTVFGLSTAAGLAWWASGAAHLNGLTNDDNLSLSNLPGTGLQGVILCGLVLASLGVLNDVTVTQASAVWEIAAQAPHLRVRGLFTSGMRIGRDHLASTVYTIAFAYAGAALPTLMMVEMFSTPWLQVLTSGQVAEEVVRTLVGAIGLVLAIPVTTLVAAVVVTLGTTQPPRSASDDVALTDLDALPGTSPAFQAT